LRDEEFFDSCGLRNAAGFFRGVNGHSRGDGGIADADQSASNSAQQKQDNQNDQKQAQSAGRAIPPTPAVRPSRERADQQQNEHNH
jgi:hypothetical protein